MSEVPPKEAPQGVLSDKAILRYMKEGKVIIEPFRRENLASSSYDVTLGEYYYRESEPEPGRGIYNPFSETMVKQVWGGVHTAETHRAWSERTGIVLENIGLDDKIIWLQPGETVLGHTQEFIGGDISVTTMMKARSSLGRNFIEVCKCAGWGDVGYFNRWTMEITNNSLFYSIPLVVGRRIAQIVFFDTEGTEGALYSQGGKYQSNKDVYNLTVQWSPQLMLPKMYLDREVGAVQK